MIFLESLYVFGCSESSRSKAAVQRTDSVFIASVLSKRIPVKVLWQTNTQNIEYKVRMEAVWMLNR